MMALSSRRAMKLVLKITAALVIGTVLGLFLTYFTVVRPLLPDRISDGPWSTNLSNGDAAGDPYTRARVALHGPLALNRSETIYYSANRDGDGDRLDGGCIYELSGRDPDARWWSITAYGPEGDLIPNPANRYSVSKTSVVHDASGDFTIRVGGTPNGANWIALGSGHPSLNLRLYNPGPLVSLDPAHAALPAITKVTCP